MIAPKKIDMFCEILQALQPIFVIGAGGPTMIAAFLVAQGVDPSVLIHLSTLPWWVVPVFAMAAYFDGLVLKMCYPGVQLPTTANSHSATASTVTVTTPDMGPEHPPTTVTVSPSPEAPTTTTTGATA